MARTNKSTWQAPLSPIQFVLAQHHIQIPNLRILQLVHHRSRNELFQFHLSQEFARSHLYPYTSFQIWNKMYSQSQISEISCGENLCRLRRDVLNCYLISYHRAQLPFLCLSHHTTRDQHTSISWRCTPKDQHLYIQVTCLHDKCHLRIKSAQMVAINQPKNWSKSYYF